MNLLERADEFYLSILHGEEDEVWFYGHNGNNELAEKWDTQDYNIQNVLYTIQMLYAPRVLTIDESVLDWEFGRNDD